VTPTDSRPSLRRCLSEAGPGGHVICYLTIGDPPGRFEQAADEIIEAGSLALELGFPHPAPREGAVLAASHRRALESGVDAAAALAMLRGMARRHPSAPLIAVVQWDDAQSGETGAAFLDGLADAGAAALLPIGAPLGAVARLADELRRRELELVLSCAPDASPKLRERILSLSSGCVYVPRSASTGSAAAADVAGFCRLLAAESDVPIVVGFGVRDARDVADIGATPAKAAAVGSALVEHLAAGGSAGEFVRRLLPGGGPAS
jgi:tryptophan synthase alpha chain